MNKFQRAFARMTCCTNIFIIDEVAIAPRERIQVQRVQVDSRLHVCAVNK